MEGNKKIAVNTLIIYIRLFVVSIVSLAVSRVVLDALGASDFGLYNVIGGLVLLLNVLNSSMASTTYRYLAFELGKKENGDTNKVFNTSISIHVIFAFLIVVIGIPLGLFYINNYLNVNLERLPDARFIFFISIATAAVNTISVPFQGLLVAYEKFFATAIIDIISNIFKVVSILLFIYSDTNRIRLYSFLILAYTLLMFCMFFFYCILYHRDVVKYRKCNDHALYRSMLSFSAWTMYGAAANVGKTQGSAMVLNYFFGTIINAAYAVANQVETFVLMFSRTMNSAAVPQTTKSFSSGDLSRSVSLTSHISKYTFLLMTLVSFPILIEMDWLLSIWLKEIPEGTTVFCRLIILGGLIGCLGEGIPNLINACGKIKGYQVVVHTVLLLGLPVSYVLYKAGCSPFTIAIVYCAINFINSFVKLYMLRKVVVFNVLEFIKVSHLRILLVAIPLAIYYCVSQNLSDCIGDIWNFVLAFLYLIACIYFIGLDKDEKKSVFKMIKK